MESLNFLITNTKRFYSDKNFTRKFIYDDITILSDLEKQTNGYVHETENYIIFAQTNYHFISLLRQNINNLKKYIEDHQQEIQWGFVLIYEKMKRGFELFNDVWGIFPVYYTRHNDEFIISGDYKKIVELRETNKINDNAVLDYMLFNYPLNERTLIGDIFQLKGGSKIKYANGNLSVNRTINFAQLIMSEEYKNGNLMNISERLSSSLISNIDPNLPSYLTLTGGFDSRTILSFLMTNNLKIKCFTFGAEGSIDHLVAKNTAEMLGLDYLFIDIASEFIEQIDTYIKNFISFSPNPPLILDTIQYELVKELLPESNIITGFMGGELISGPTVISEVTSTEAAMELLTTSDKNEFEQSVYSILRKFNFIDLDFYKSIKNDYLDGISNYLMKDGFEKKENITNFLVNEVYAKFFGTIFKVLFSKFNIVSGFMDFDLLKIILNSKYSYVNNKAFTKNPLSHFKSKVLYSNIIKNTYPPLLETKLDRGYKIGDLTKWYKFSKVGFHYLQNHLFHKNKTQNLKTLNYPVWMRDIIIEKLRESELIRLPYFNKNGILELINKIENKEFVPNLHIRKLILLLGLNYFYDEYKSQNNYL